MACQPRQVFTRFALAAAIASVLPAGRGLAQERDRSKIPEKYKWNTADIYPSDEAWRTAKERLLAEIPKLKAFRGTLGSSDRSAARNSGTIPSRSDTVRTTRKLFHVVLCVNAS